MGQLAEWLGQLIEALRSTEFGDPDVWPYALLAILVAVEGPLSTLLAAAAAAAGYLDVRLVLIVTVLGNIIGDVGWYFVGYFGLHGRLLRYGRWLGLRPQHLARLERAMHDHAQKLLFLSKVAYGLIVPALLAAGMARVPLRRWLPVVIVMETAWSLVLVWIGFHAAWLISDFERGLRMVGLLVVAGLVLVLMLKMRTRVSEAEMELDPLRQVLLREEDPLPSANGASPVRPTPAIEATPSNGATEASSPVSLTGKTKEPSRPALP